MKRTKCIIKLLQLLNTYLHVELVSKYDKHNLQNNCYSLCPERHLLDPCQ